MVSLIPFVYSGCSRSPLTEEFGKISDISDINDDQLHPSDLNELDILTADPDTYNADDFDENPSDELSEPDPDAFDITSDSLRADDALDDSADTNDIDSTIDISDAVTDIPDRDILIDDESTDIEYMINDCASFGDLMVVEARRINHANSTCTSVTFSSFRSSSICSSFFCFTSAYLTDDLAYCTSCHGFSSNELDATGTFEANDVHITLIDLILTFPGGGSLPEIVHFRYTEN